MAVGVATGPLVVQAVSKMTIAATAMALSIFMNTPASESDYKELYPFMLTPVRQAARSSSLTQVATLA